jgi:hypothetical protein
VTPFERFHSDVERALERHLDDLCDHDSAHEHYCLCPECVCVRGVREELKSYAKAMDRRGKKRGKAG